MRLVGSLVALGWLAAAMPAMAQCAPGQTVVEAGFGGKICQGQPRTSVPAPRPTQTITRTYGGAGTNAAAAIFSGLAAGGILLDALRPEARQAQEPSPVELQRNDMNRQAQDEHAEGLRLLRSGRCFDAWPKFGAAMTFFQRTGNSHNAAVARRNMTESQACRNAQLGHDQARADDYSAAETYFSTAADLFGELGLSSQEARYRKLSALAKARVAFASARSDEGFSFRDDEAIEGYRNAARIFSENGDARNSEISRGNADRVARAKELKRVEAAALDEKARAWQAEAEAKARAREQAEEAARNVQREADRRRAEEARARASAEARAAEQANREIQEQATRERFAEAQALSRNPYGDSRRFSEAAEEHLYYDSACEPNVYCDRVYRDGSSSRPVRKVSAPAPVQDTRPPDDAAVKAARDEMMKSYLEELKRRDPGGNHADVVNKIQQAYDEASNR